MVGSQPPGNRHLVRIPVPGGTAHLREQLEEGRVLTSLANQNLPHPDVKPRNMTTHGRKRSTFSPCTLCSPVIPDLGPDLGRCLV